MADRGAPPDSPGGAVKAAVREVSPEIAEFLNEVVAAFGRPQAVRVKVAGVVVYQYGQVDDERERDGWECQ